MKAMTRTARRFTEAVRKEEVGVHAVLLIVTVFVDVWVLIDFDRMHISPAVPVVLGLFTLLQIINLARLSHRAKGPRLTVLMIPHNPVLGEEIELHWEFRSMPDRVRNVRFQLEEFQRVHYGSDSVEHDTRSFEDTFLERHLVHDVTGEQARSGAIRYSLPYRDDLCIRGKWERIWKLSINARVDGAPNVRDRHELGRIPDHHSGRGT